LHAILAAARLGAQDPPRESAYTSFWPLRRERATITCMQSVQVVEVAPRDGLQNERAILPTEAKLELVPRWPRPGCGGSR
jgi:hypothetical protein